MSNYANPAAIIRDVCEAVRPPRRLKVSESAARVVRLEVPGGYAGPWDPATSPYMVEPMNMLAERVRQSVVFVGPARTGKTQALIDCWLGHAVTSDPGDMGIYLPTQDNASDYSKRRISRLHRHSPEIAAKLSPRAHDDNIFMKAYRHGMLLSILWPTPGQLAQRDFKYVALSDYDAMPQDVDQGQSPFDLARKRVTTAMSGGMCLAESSPRFPIIDPRWKPAHPHEAPPVSGGVLALYNQGDRRRWYWLCRDCQDWFLVPPLPNYDDSIDDPVKAGESAHIVCHCGAIYEPRHKRELNLAGRWVPQFEFSPIASYWLTGSAAAFQSWASLVANYVRALREFRLTGQEESLRSTCSIDQGIAYLSPRLGQMRSAQDLAARVEEWPVRTVPDGVWFMLALADTQARRFQCSVIGYGPGGEEWLIDRFEISQSKRQLATGDYAPIDPAGYVEDWIQLADDVLARRYPRASDPEQLMQVRELAIDSGGKAGATERAYRFWQMCQRTAKRGRVRLLKGDPHAKDKSARIRETWPDAARKDRRAARIGGIAPVWLIATNLIKDTLDADLRKTEHGPGFVHLPAWIQPEVFDELCSEVKTAKGWERIGGAPNEEFDLHTYGRAVCIALGVEKWGADWAGAPAWARPFVAGEAKPRAAKVAKPRPVSSGFGSAEWNL